MWISRVAFFLLLYALTPSVTFAQLTVNTDRLRFNAGPCVVSSVDGTPDKLLLSTCPVLTTPAATNLTLNPTGDLILSPDGSDILPDTGYVRNLGALNNKYLTLHAAELWVETLVAQNTIATIGGRVLVAPTTTLTADLAPAATTISVKHNQMVNGDRVYLEANGSVEFMAIASAPSGSGPYTYTVTRNLDGSGANQWYAGDAILNTGTTGKGFIDLYSTAGVLSGSGPTIVGNVRTGTTYNQIAPRWAIGNLNGLYGYGAETYGTAFGDASATNVTIDATNGFRIRSGTTNKLVADTAGNLSLTGDLSIGTGSLFRTASATSFSTGDGFYFSGGSTPQVRIGNPAGNRLTYESSTGFLILYGNGAGLTQIGPGSLTVGAGRNMVRNADCAVNTGDWSTFTDSGLTISLGSSLATWRLNDTADNTCYLTLAGTPAVGKISIGFLSNSLRLPATAGLRYEASAYLGVHRSGNSEVLITFLDSAGTTAVGQATGNTCTAASAGGTNLSGYCRSGVIATAPAGTYSVRIDIRTTHTAEANPYLFWVHAYLGEAQSGQTLLTPWGPSGVTQITGDLVKTGSLVADNIAAGTITGAKIAGGTITGSLIAGGTITGGLIAGSTITADKLSVSSLSAINANLGTVTAGTISGVSATFGSGSEVSMNSSGITIADYVASTNSRLKWSGGSFVVGYTSGGQGITLSADDLIIVSSNYVELGKSGANINMPKFVGGGAQTLCVSNTGNVYTVGSGVAC